MQRSISSVLTCSLSFKFQECQLWSGNLNLDLFDLKTYILSITWKVEEGKK